MTLQEAHELQRRELMSLRAENQRLKKGTFPADEKESLERKIRHLDQVCKTKDRRYEEARSFWRTTHQLNRDLEMEIIELKEGISTLEATLENYRSRALKAEEEVRDLNGTNVKLNAKLNKSFENSSLPSSALPFRKRITNNRKKTNKKPGAQVGHIGSSRQRLLTTVQSTLLPTPPEFLDNPNIYPTGKTITKQVIDIQMNVIVHDFVADEYRHRITGSRIHAPFPQGIVNEVNYGCGLKSFAFLLNNYYNVSINKTQQCISDITHGIVSISTGMINSLAKEFSVKTELDRTKIFSNLLHSNAMYSDATVSNINGSRKAVILCTDKEHVLYQHLEHKGHEGLKNTPVKDYKGILIHDHDRTYYSYGSSHQECLAHVLRYLVSAIENEPHLKWHKQMHSLLQKIIHTSKKSKDHLPNEKKISFKNKYFEILELAKIEYLANPPSEGFLDGYNLQKRLNKYADSHLLFLEHPEIDYTNNISERCLRKFKRKQKQAVVFRSTSGGERICDALTVIETARLQNQNIYATVKAAFEK